MKKSDKKGETALLREHAEQQFAEELSELAKADDRQRPPNWRLSPWAVAIYILGGKLDYTKLRFPQVLFVMLIIRAKPGDKRNWELIERWAEGLKFS